MSQEVSPYSNYEFLRAAGEMHWTGRTWLVLSHEAVAEGLIHPSLSARRVDLLFPAGTSAEFTALRQTLRSWTFFSDVTDVKAERKFIWDQLGPKAFGNLSDLVKSVTEAALSNARLAGGKLDVLKGLTMPMRVAIARVFLELEASDAEIRTACAEADHLFDFITGSNAAGDPAQASASLVQIQDFLSRSALLKKTELSKESLLDQLALLLVVSVFIEKAIANVMAALIQTQGAFEACQRGEFDFAVREALRLESPTQITSRVAIQDFSWRGQMIKSGDQVSLVIGAANRDGLAFSNPTEFVSRASEAKPLTFGAGGKRCPGEWMTSAIVEHVFRTMFKTVTRLPKIQEIRWIVNPESRRTSKFLIEI